MFIVVWYWHIKKCLSQTDIKKKMLSSVRYNIYWVVVHGSPMLDYGVSAVHFACMWDFVPKDIPQQPPPTPIILSVSPETWPLLSCIAIVYWYMQYIHIYIYIYAVYILHSNITLQCMCARTTCNIYVYII